MRPRHVSLMCSRAPLPVIYIGYAKSPWAAFRSMRKMNGPGRSAGTLFYLSHYTVIRVIRVIRIIRVTKMATSTVALE